jgi:outer membrane receptor protein involved in Fe transport
VYKYLLLAAASPAAFIALPAAAQATTQQDGRESAKEGDAPARTESFSTGVAKARDPLDSATSTSMLTEETIAKLGPRSIPELLRLVPGVRSEAPGGEGFGNITIRGLPLSGTGSKFTQIQEDGLPVLEFGDIAWANADFFIRPDYNLAGVQVIRGGSASTFASNSPGGVINFISKTGVVEGGTIAATTGLDYKRHRIDFDYGGQLSDTVRFHVGGFYRRGEGPRHVGYDAERGGQIKLNVTKEFDGGYIRLYGKYLNDRTPAYGVTPIAMSGTNADPKLSAVANYDPSGDTLMSRHRQGLLTYDRNNELVTSDLTDGQHPVVKAVGVEAQFELGGWTVTNRFRYSDIGGAFRGVEAVVVNSAAAMARQYGGAGAILSYANGPDAGAVIADPSTLNGNGLMASQTYANQEFRSFDNLTNDLRASRVWSLGGAEVTTTAGLYKSRQDIDVDYLWNTVFSEILGNGNAAQINIATAAGVPVTQDGYYSFGPFLTVMPHTRHYTMDATYDVLAPYASMNVRIGELALGGSIRYDMVDAEGQYLRGVAAPQDVNGDGTLSAAERRTALFDPSAVRPLDYSTDYMSYSVSANYRIAKSLSTFARYSRGGRTNSGDRLILNGFVNASGGLNDPGNAVDMVKQLEGGFKFRSNGLMLQITGFKANAQDTNSLRTAIFNRVYDAKGFELEGEFRRGWFNLNAGATYTKAKITEDQSNPAIVGNKPPRQADWIFQVVPQVTTEKFSIGAAFIGTTESYTEVQNELRMPGYVTTDLFVRYNLTRQLALTVNANNLFDVYALTAMNDTTLPTSGVGLARLLNGRNVSATLSFDF